jgi:transposase-like protein
VNNCSAGELVPIIKKLAPSDSTIYSDEWKAYDGLVNAGYKKSIIESLIVRMFLQMAGLTLTELRTFGELQKIG